MTNKRLDEVMADEVNEENYKSGSNPRPVQTYRKFDQVVEEHVKSGKYVDAKKLQKPGEKTIYRGLEKAREMGVAPEIIARTEERGMLANEIEFTYEGAKRIYESAKKDLTPEQNRVIDRLDKVRDLDVIVAYLFGYNKSIKQKLQNRENIYKVALTYGAHDQAEAEIKKAKKPRKRGFIPVEERADIARHSLPDRLAPIKDLVSQIPEDERGIDDPDKKAARFCFQEKAVRDTFAVFKVDPAYAFKYLDDAIEAEDDEIMIEVYEGLKKTYEGYTSVRYEGVNEEFIDPVTKEKGVLPSLHQKMAIYHLLEKKRLGIFDGCGTGKTASAIIAQKSIEKKLEDKLKKEKRKMRTVVVCPNNAKKAWKKGLMGDKEHRYLAEKQDVEVIGQHTNKDKQFIESLKDKSWIVVNYDQLIKGVKGSKKLLVDELIGIGIDYVIFDESHNIKSKKLETKVHKTYTKSLASRMLGLSSEYLALLSGTPIPDTMDDYAVMYHLLRPHECPDPKKFKKLYDENARRLHILFNENTVRKTSSEINEDLVFEDLTALVDLDPVQRRIYDFLVERHPVKRWCSEARKSLLDPRLVDPAVLQKLGLIGKLSYENSAKYKRLEEILTSDDGPVANDEKFVVFSTEFMSGVTQAQNHELKKKYEELGLLDAYESLGLDTPLGERLEIALKKRFNKDIKVGVIDGSVNGKKGKTKEEVREGIVDGLKDNLGGILCTTETGGESLDFTDASYCFFLDQGFVPKTEDQARDRLVRKGQENDVKIIHLRGKKTMDQDLQVYVTMKRIISKIAVDGYKLIPKEQELLEDTEGEQFNKLVQKSLGAVSIDGTATKILDENDFKTKNASQKAPAIREHVAEADSDSTDGQKVGMWIGRDRFGCWSDEEFQELYHRAMNELATPVFNRARAADILRRAVEGEINFPERILADASGPSFLYDAYQSIANLIMRRGLYVPEIYDRDIEPGMHAKEGNPNKVVGCMTGIESPFKDNHFDLVDNGSLYLLPNSEKVKETLLEAHRVLKDGGLLHLSLKNWRFQKSFYNALPRLGFDIISSMHDTYYPSEQLMARLEEENDGTRYRDAYARKLSNTYFILARKNESVADVKASKFWFEKVSRSGFVKEDEQDIMVQAASVDIAEGGNGKNGNGRSKEKRQRKALPGEIPRLRPELQGKAKITI